MAEEEVQEAYEGIWRTAADFDPARGSALAWMAGVTRNRALDLLRKRGRGDTPIEDDVLERLMHEAASLRADQADLDALQIGRASCRERVCRSVSISVVAGTLNKKKNTELKQ